MVITLENFGTLTLKSVINVPEDAIAEGMCFPFPLSGKPRLFVDIKDYGNGQSVQGKGAYICEGDGKSERYIAPSRDETFPQQLNLPTLPHAECRKYMLYNPLKLGGYFFLVMLTNTFSQAYLIYQLISKQIFSTCFSLPFPLWGFQVIKCCKGTRP